ncbi:MULTISPECIES: wax ester/triacylglycerol synthase family O-acyltransferase [Mycobacteriaceae]|uniref:Diacylglycerol O-acyltransferase n=1 Tax=Mycolicibacterium neoaurum VKM Ac-1815D TaxID=700508 RepID=V5XG79_MYCNE|nr:MULTISPECIES: wax ester/triacylglycerol synthase family O-acyltransferase [Mycobacteriaceae]AHC27430.1 acyltransferase [Mycolicibacterium neoaurum VKM Ac-1815D]AMO07643.1 acyltransferase [Mycolicibacterium neoaurum]AXK73969.1 wax ester/triacylglycerol synthase family O-acyltransferase [Mycolicibacterium neoaurum]KJQ51596.1 acyltransferase [Mycolicibacterium neoaurum]KUM08826.1 acyltransferase [Mycolicibacterium neoaurum]
MEQLTGYDASFLYLETPTHFHQGCGVIILDTSTVPGGYTFERLRTWLSERIQEIPTYTEKAFDPWYNLGHPFWMKDRSFDLDHHLHRVSIAAPGTQRELAAECSRIASIPLDQHRPLWTITVLEGLADGNVAVLIKRHNASLDGVRGNSQLGQLCGTAANQYSVVRDAGDAEPLRVAVDGLKTFVGKPVKLARMLYELIHARRHRETPVLPPGVPSPMSAPRTSFNTTLTPNRNLAWVSLPLADVVDAKRLLGVKLNDVMLALTADVVRHYLLQRGELPEVPLQAFVPASVHDKPGQHGRNRTTGLLTSLQTLTVDPVRRAHEIASITDAAKRHAEALGPGRIHDRFDFSARYWGLLFSAYSRLRMADRHSVMQNLVLSNIGGRHTDLYFAGARITAFYPFGAPFDGGALFVTIASHEDQLNVGLIACPEILPDLADLAAGFPRALAELKRALETAPCD